VLIVGAGPAGMECAVVLGKRGFTSVHLVEAEPEIGGRLRWARRLPTLGDWGRIIDWRTVQLARLPGVEVITGHRLTRTDVLEYGADLVVIATGSVWRGDGAQPGYPDAMPGADPGLPRVLTPEQACAGKRPPGPRVVVYDADGYYVAPGVAEMLAADGYEVTVVTTFDVLSPVSDQTLEGDMLRAHLCRAGVSARHATTITGISAASVTGHDRHGEVWSAACDGVVLVTQQASQDALYHELASDETALAAAGISGVYRIGDAVAPRMISEAIFDGHRLAREIDGKDPAVPAPYRRERADLG
jgi:dimethylamine/trimethylamine dehydrogenase